MDEFLYPAELLLGLMPPGSMATAAWEPLDPVTIAGLEPCLDCTG
jgi:hypothetical protein